MLRILKSFEEEDHDLWFVNAWYRVGVSMVRQCVSIHSQYVAVGSHFAMTS